MSSVFSTAAPAMVALIPLTIAGCSAPINTGSAWAPNTAVNQSIGRTFEWAQFTGTPPLSPEAGEIREMVHQTIDRQLAAQGYQKGTVDRADFWVVARLSRSQQGDPRASVPFEEYSEGSLHVYVVDPRTRQWRWRAWADTRLQLSNPPEVKRKRLNEAVERMFKSFPPGGRPRSDRQP